MSGYLEIVGKRDYIKDNDREMLERIQSEVKRINGIIRELLDFSRPHDKSKESINLNISVESALTLITAQKSFDTIDVKTKLGEPPGFMANKSSIQQVIMNLVLNAAHSMKDGGVLEIITEKKDKENRIGSLLTVKDNGDGMSEDMLVNIFDPFFTTKEPGEGTGLGLSVCQRIIEDLDGKISVSSKEDEGTEFFVWIPETKMEKQRQ
jgi:two-component system, NtrC family, sensor kinase